LAQEFQPNKPPPAASHYCKSLSSLIRETYAHCHVPCVRVPAGWSAGEDSDDDDSALDEALDTKQVRSVRVLDHPNPFSFSFSFSIRELNC
jgi:hypothetical protein